LQGLKKKHDEVNGKWAEELHGVLWALRTTMKAATGETLFMLAYRSEVAPPVEVARHTHRLITFQEELNNAITPFSDKHSTSSASHVSMIKRSSCSQFRSATLFFAEHARQRAWQAHGQLGRPI